MHQTNNQQSYRSRHYVLLSLDIFKK